MFGAGIAAIGLIAHLEIAAVVLFMPAALDFALKLTSKNPFGQRKAYGNTQSNAGRHSRPRRLPGAGARIHERRAHQGEDTSCCGSWPWKPSTRALAVVVTLVHF